MRPERPSAQTIDPDASPYQRHDESVTESREYWDAYTVDCGLTIRVGDQFWHRPSREQLEVTDVVERVRTDTRGVETSRGPILVAFESDHPEHERTIRVNVEEFASLVGTDDDAMYVPHDANGWLPRGLCL